MELKVFVLVLQLCWLFQENSAEIVCSEDIHTACPSKDFYQMFREDSFSLLTNNAMINHCRGILDDIECKRNFLTTCKVDFLSFDIMTSGIKGVFSDLCNETSQFRKDYMKHTECVGKQVGSYDECLVGSIASVAHDESDNSVDNPSPTVTVEKFCRLYDLFKSCSSAITLEKCGSAAANHFENLIFRIFGELKRVKCSYLDT